MAATLPEPVADAIVKAYRDLCQAERGGGRCRSALQRDGGRPTDGILRRPAGDFPQHPGQGGASERGARARRRPLPTARSSYRENNNLVHRGVGLSVGVQKMVQSNLAPPQGSGCAGVMFTLDTESGYRDAVVINGAWGLGETVVQGRVTLDEYWVHKPTCKAGYKSVIRREVGILTRGKAVGNRIGAGPARIIHGTKDLRHFRPGEVIVAEIQC